MKTQIEDLKASIDAIETAIECVTQQRDNGQACLPFANSALAELQVIRLDYALQLRAAQRNAEKELSRVIEDIPKFDRHLHDPYFDN